MSKKLKKIDLLCDYIRKLHYDSNLEYSKALFVDRQIELQSRITLLEVILDEAAMIKRKAKK